MVAFRQKATHRKEGETIDKRNNSSFRLLISNLLSCGKKFQIANEHESKRLILLLGRITYLIESYIQNECSLGLAI